VTAMRRHPAGARRPWSLPLLLSMVVPAVLAGGGPARARPRPHFEPTDLDLEDTGVLELDLQLGPVRGPDAWRVMLPDFELDLGLLLKDLVDVAQRHEIAEGKTLSFTGKSEDVFVHVDSEQMRQVLMNLVLNALEAVEPEGQVEVRIGARRDRPGKGSGKASSWVCAEVQDNGIGIAAPEIELIFEPFYSTKRGGTGLGLAIANRIVERHGGVLEVESRLGAGTTMRVWVPRTTSTAKTVAHAA